MSKFKVGDRVRVVKNGTTSGDKDQYIGKTYIIESVFGEDNYTYWGKVLGRAYSVGGSHVIYEREMVLAEHPKVILTTDGTTTLARLYEGDKVVKSAKAVCSPEDTFDFTVGAQLAYDRLMGEEKAKEEPKPEPTSDAVQLYCVKDCGPGEWLTKGKVYDVVNGQITFDDGWTCDYDGIQIYDDDTQIDQLCVPLVSRPAKVGEWVYVHRTKEPADGYRQGDVFRVEQLSNVNKSVIREPFWVTNYEYLVLDGYQPEPETCKCCGRVMSK